MNRHLRSFPFVAAAICLVVAIQAAVLVGQSDGPDTDPLGFSANTVLADNQCAPAVGVQANGNPTSVTFTAPSGQTASQVWIHSGGNCFGPAVYPPPNCTPTSCSTTLNNGCYTVTWSNNGQTVTVTKTGAGSPTCQDISNIEVVTARGAVTPTPTVTPTRTVTPPVTPTRTVMPTVTPTRTVTPTGFQGCTPGYWKQQHHFDSWTPPYDPTDQFSSFFENAFPGMTLDDVLGQGGGGLNALGRQTVAALLNAASPGVNYPYTPEQVINMFNSVFPGGDYDRLKNSFEQANERSCPLD
jgi:hypothetical protein